jgi:hypothetical protein
MNYVHFVVDCFNFHKCIHNNNSIKNVMGGNLGAKKIGNYYMLHMVFNLLLKYFNYHILLWPLIKLMNSQVLVITKYTWWQYSQKKFKMGWIAQGFHESTCFHHGDKFILKETWGTFPSTIWMHVGGTVVSSISLNKTANLKMNT